MADDGSGSGGEPSHWPTRRHLLRTVGSTGAVAALAGCGEVTEYEFRADPVVLPTDRRRALEYAETTSESVVETRSRTVAGADVDVTVESQVRGYRALDGTLRTTVVAPDLGVLSTPGATVEGESFNPLADRPVGELLESDAGRAFLERVGLAEVTDDSDRLRWERGPTVVARAESSCLGTSTTIRTHAGILDGEQPSVAFVHATRVEDDSVVIATAVHGEAVEDPGRPFVHEDRGYATEGGLGRASGILDEACRWLEYGGEGS